MQALLTKYGPGKLYQVTSNTSGSRTLDLSLPRGQIVALLQNKDTKGNSSRWLVDTGGMWDLVGPSPPSGKTTQQDQWETQVSSEVRVWPCTSKVGIEPR